MKNRRKKKFITSIFLGNLVMIIIPVTIVALLINSVMHSYLVGNIVQKDKMMLFNVEQNIDAFLGKAIGILKFVDLMADFKSGAEMDREIERINGIDSYFENIEILDTNGSVISTLPVNVKQIGHNRSGEDYFKSLGEKDGVYWSVPFISSVSGEPTVTVAIEETDRIIVGYLNLSYLGTLANKFTEADPDLKVSILDNYGIYISNFNIDLVHQRQMEPKFDLVRQYADAKWPVEFSADDKHIMVAIKTENPDWYLLIYDDFRNSMNSADTLLLLFVSLFFASIVTFIVLTLIRSRSINKYIDQFLRQTEILASGKFDINFTEQKYDEFARLSDDFRSMAEKLKARDQKLEWMAYTDSLTGIRNRAYLKNPTLQKVEAERYGMIFLDIDNFKNINDSFGHSLGDELLVAVAEKLKKCVDEQTVLARFGGDEFVVVIPDEGRGKRLEATINAISETFRAPLQIDSRSFFVTVSMGISVSDAEVFDFDTMLMDADIAMYYVKKSGKNNFKYYSPAMDKQIRNRLLIEQHLRTALENDELRLVYQPLILTETGKIRGFEALLRWENPELGAVSPLDFIPVAEETGMIVKIGEWVLKTACEAIQSINFAYGTDYVMSINVSPIEINRPNFLNSTYDIVKETGIKNEWIEIEITENVLLTDIDQIIAIIIHLESTGISVSLDDFGTGYSSLSYLNKLPVSTLKIDREFIRELFHSKNSQKMVDSIILLAHKLGMFLVAEGVENMEQAKLLENFSCDCLQGYYFSKPLDPDKLREFIERAGKDYDLTL